MKLVNRVAMGVAASSFVASGCAANLAPAPSPEPTQQAPVCTEMSDFPRDNVPVELYSDLEKYSHFSRSDIESGALVGINCDSGLAFEAFDAMNSIEIYPKDLAVRCIVVGVLGAEPKPGHYYNNLLAFCPVDSEVPTDFGTVTPTV